MTTDPTTETVDAEPVGVVIVHPITGEVIDLAASPTDQIAAAFEDIGVLVQQVIDVRQALADELARRLDTVNTRNEQVGDWLIEVNAGTEEVYAVAPMRAALEPLVTAGVLDAEVLRRVITYPAPKAPDARVDKREVNKLKRHPDPSVQAALAQARTISPVKRKVQVIKTVTPRVELEEGPDA